jgi:hypothetical protein
MSGATGYVVTKWDLLRAAEGTSRQDPARILAGRLLRLCQENIEIAITILEGERECKDLFTLTEVVQGLRTGMIELLKEAQRDLLPSMQQLAQSWTVQPNSFQLLADDPEVRAGHALVESKMSLDGAIHSLMEIARPDSYDREAIDLLMRHRVQRMAQGSQDVRA